MKLFQSPISINYLEINKDEIFTQLKIYIKNLEKKILSQIIIISFFKRKYNKRHNINFR